MLKESTRQNSGLIFNIQRFCLHDGPGIRTTIFMSGCSLRCPWCANPESWSGRPQLFYQTQNCLRCEACAAICPRGALHAGDYSEKRVDRDLCDGCGKCVQVCSAAALNIKGRLMTASEVIEEVLRDQVFYDHGGGITFSGGEPLLQVDFLCELLRFARLYGLNTAVETSGLVPWSSFEAVLPDLDSIYFDLKHPDDWLHRKFTGKSNRGIIANLRRLPRTGVDLTVRLTLIPGFNSDEGALRDFASLMQELGIGQVELLDYHTLGEAKFAFLGKNYRFAADDRGGEERAEQARQILGRAGIQTSRNA